MYPNFRSNRVNDIEIDYHNCFSGIGGKRENKWFGLVRKDKKPAYIPPFRMGFILDETNVHLFFENGWIKGYEQNTFDEFINFHIKNDNSLNALYVMVGMQPFTVDDIYTNKLLANKVAFQQFINNSMRYYYMEGKKFYYPILDYHIIDLVCNFAIFFPIFDSYIQISKGEKHRLPNLLKKLSSWLDSDGYKKEFDVLKSKNISNHQIDTIVAERVRIMPSMRWRVFQRDEWKCVACGRSAHDGIVLHIDHIIPRSLGGKNCIDNYQTLCQECNIGKSNKDDTDLRNLD